MQLTELEQHVLAYFLIKAADDWQMDPRFWPPVELSSIVEDKLRFPVSRFGVGITNRAVIENPARVLRDLLIARGAFITKQGEYGPMYQFQRDAYRAAIAELRANDPIIAKAGGDANADYWEEAFDRLA